MPDVVEQEREGEFADRAVGVALAPPRQPRKRRVNSSWSTGGRGPVTAEPVLPTGWEVLLEAEGVVGDDAAAQVVERPHGPEQHRQAAAIRDFVRKHKTHWFVPLKVLEVLGEDVVFGDEGI
jgi:hypothetical protein